MKCPEPYGEYDCDELLSGKSFNNWEFHSRPEYDFNNKVIYASIFCNETPDSDIFGSIKGAIFIKCNLDNVLIPEGSIVIDCSQRRFKSQNDNEDWEIDVDGNPIRPLNHKIFSKRNLPMPKPEDIPLEKSEIVVDLLEWSKEEKIRLDQLAIEEEVVVDTPIVEG